MEQGFQKGESTNLPRIDALMIADYFATNSDFCSSEYRHVKTSASSREAHGDDANGYVQNAGSCIVKSSICPEHKVHAKPCNVSLVYNKDEGKVTDIRCHDCVASHGGFIEAKSLHQRPESATGKNPSCRQAVGTLKKIKTKDLTKQTKHIVIICYEKIMQREHFSSSWLIHTRGA